MMTTDPARREGPPPPAASVARRAVPTERLRTFTDEVRLFRQIQYGRAFVRLAGGRDPYPDPRWNAERAMPYGLTVDEARAEWIRKRQDGWQNWELEKRLKPSPVADPAGVARGRRAAA